MRVAIIAALTLAAAGSAFAQCVNSGTTSAFLGSNINLLAGSGASNSLLSSGTAFWSGNCTGMGQTFPGFTVGGGGTGPTYTVQVLGHNGSGDGASTPVVAMN